VSRQEGPEAPSVRRWDYRGAPHSNRADRTDRFHEQLREALRIASASPVDLRLRWSSGPAARVRIEAADRPTLAWTTGALLPSYPLGSWTEVVSPVGAVAPRVAVGAALRGLDRPFRRSSPLSSPWSDSVASALLFLPRGAEIEWRLRPVRSGASAPPPLPAPLAQPPGWRIPPPTETARRLDEGWAARAVAPLWDLRAELFARRPESADALGRLVASASQEDGGNGIRWRRATGWFARSAPPILLSLEEIASWFPSPRLRLPSATGSIATGTRTIPLGRTVTGELRGLPIEPDQGRHVLLLGETGMGKSSLLVRQTVRAAALGGVVFFDPIGDTSHRLLDRLPEAALSRVVWISPANSPVGINALAPATVGPPRGDRALGELVQALRRVRVGRYADSPFWGPRVEEMVTLALRAAACYPDGTIHEAAELLDGVAGGLRGVPPEAEDAVRALAGRVRSRPDEIDGARRVFGEVLNTPILARMLAARRSTFSIAEAVRAGRIVVVSGDAPEIGEAAARTLLSVHLALLWVEVVARTSSGKIFVVVDELQWYANDAVVEMLRLGRRFNVHVWAATQSLSSLPESVREAAVTNAADLVVFRGSPDDARELARWSPDVPAETVLGLRRGEAAVLLGKGGDVGWVRLPFDPDRPRPERWSAAWEQCRGLWSPRQDSPGLEPAPVPDADPVRAVLLVLWSGLLAEGGGDSVVVSVDALRAVADPSGAAVRSVGQQLSSLGALTLSGSGAFRNWTVARSGVATLLAPGVAPHELRDADHRWERLRSTAGDSSARKGL
jgi:hypothetical protein